MAKKPISRLHELSARIEKHLTQFEPMDDESDYSPVSREEKKKRNPLLRAGVAGGTVAGVAALTANKDKVKAGYQGAKDATRAAVAKGVGKTAGVMDRAGAAVSGAGIDAAGKLRKSKMAGKAADLLEKGAVKTGNRLLKGGSFLKKVKFNAKLAQQLVRIERKLCNFERQDRE